MPNLLSNYVGGSKPKLITRLTSGTGTYVPTADMARCLVFVQAGGSGGHSSNTNYGGGAGQCRVVTMRIPIAGVSYVVGAGGGSATAGGNSKFDVHVAHGGQPSSTNSGGGYGSGCVDGIPGGCGGGGSGSGAAGWPATITSPATGSSGAYGGGDSAFGKGGVPGGAAATGYGSGEASGSGRTAPGGVIEIWDFGA